MANLYTQADSNIRKTWLYMTGFFIAVILLGWLFSYLLDNAYILYIAAILAVVQSISAYWYSDKIVLSMANAIPIQKADSPEFYRIVENLCITAGLPLPKIYVIDEAQPNAFATGRDKDHAVIAVTRGLLERLDKSELEGVIAHELSHIGNSDILLGTVAVVLVGLVAILSDWFLRISFWSGERRGRDQDRGTAGIILLVAGILAAILAPLAAMMMQLAISRKREFLADTDGALLTRYPQGLARALIKISQDPHRLSTANTTTAHLYIANPFRGAQRNNWISKMFSTHPPIEERVKALTDMEV